MRPETPLYLCGTFSAYLCVPCVKYDGHMIYAETAEICIVQSALYLESKVKGRDRIRSRPSLLLATERWLVTPVTVAVSVYKTLSEVLRIKITVT